MVVITQETLDKLRDEIKEALSSQTKEGWEVGITYDDLGSYIVQCKYGDFRYQHTIPIRKMKEYQELRLMGVGEYLTAVALKHFLEKGKMVNMAIVPARCHDCGAEPGQPHESGCDVERCSVCGGQWIQCGHEDHDPLFARWTGFWPGKLEAVALGISLNEFLERGLDKLFFVKPTCTGVPGQ